MDFIGLFFFTKFAIKMYPILILALISPCLKAEDTCLTATAFDASGGFTSAPKAFKSFKLAFAVFTHSVTFLRVSFFVNVYRSSVSIIRFAQNAL